MSGDSGSSRVTQSHKTKWLNWEQKKNHRNVRHYAVRWNTWAERVHGYFIGYLYCFSDAATGMLMLVYNGHRLIGICFFSPADFLKCSLFFFKICRSFFVLEREMFAWINLKHFFLRCQTHWCWWTVVPLNSKHFFAADFLKCIFYCSMQVFLRCGEENVRK